VVLLLSTGIQQPSVSSQLDYYTSKVTAVVSMTLTAVDIQGADLSEPLVLFWHHHPVVVCGLWVAGSEMSLSI